MSRTPKSIATLHNDALKLCGLCEIVGFLNNEGYHDMGAITGVIFEMCSDLTMDLENAAAAR